jgi:hypothetical protein
MIKITKTLLATALTVAIAYAAVTDPTTRLEQVRDLFTQYGPDAFKLLNGQDLGGTGTGSGTGKGMTNSQLADVATIVKSDDGNAFVFCVQDSKWRVYPPEPTKVGKDAMTATDSYGMPFVETIIKALHNSPDRKAQVVYYVDTPGGKEKRIATAWGSINLLQRKNATGTKFFCGTSIRAEQQDAPGARVKK